MNQKSMLIILTISLFIGAIAYDTMFSSPEMVSVNGENKGRLDSKKWEIVPDISLKTIAGKDISTHGFEGKVILLNFWASWCPPCIHEMPSMFNLVDKSDGKVILIAISNDENEADYQKALRKFEKKYGHVINGKNTHIVWDKDKSITSDIFNIIRYPETIIITPDFKMARKIVGGDFKWDSEEFELYLKEIQTMND